MSTKVVTPSPGPKPGNHQKEKKIFSHQPKSSLPTPEERLTLLTFTPNNYVKWLENMYLVLGIKYNRLALTIKTGKFVAPHFPNMDKITASLTAKGIPPSEMNAIASLAYQEELKINKKDEAKYRSTYEEMYSYVWCYLSNESQQIVSSCDEWNDIEATRDAARLAARIAITHRLGDTKIPAIDRRKALNNYVQCRQTPTQSISEYKRNFDNALATLKESGCKVPADEDQAVDFMVGLDARRFTEFRAHLENNVLDEVSDMPATLGEMYTKASAYRVVTSSGHIVASTVYHTQATSAKQQPFPNTPKDISGSSTPVTPKHKQKVQKNKGGPPSPCKHCGGNHWNSQCPNPPTADATAEPPKPAKGTVNLTITRNTLNGSGVVLRTHTIAEDLATADDVDDVLSIDTQANVSVFHNSDLLYNLRRAPMPMIIGGIDAKGETLTATKIGDFEPLGVTAYYHPHASANVICFYDLTRVCTVDYNQENNLYTVRHPHSAVDYIFTPAADPADPNHKQ
jgi:hypothetical protein